MTAKKAVTGEQTAAAESKASLGVVFKSMHDAFPDSPRLDILDAQIATVEMTVDHILDEHTRQQPEA